MDETAATPMGRAAATDDDGSGRHRCTQAGVTGDGGALFEREVAVDELYLLFGVVLDDDGQLSEHELRRVKIRFQ